MVYFFLDLVYIHLEEMTTSHQTSKIIRKESYDVQIRITLLDPQIVNVYVTELHDYEVYWNV